MKRLLFIVLLLLNMKGYSQCAAPTALSISLTTTNSVSFTFQSGGSSPWEAQYGPVGFNLGNGTVQSISSKSTTLFGLSGATTFDLYVRDVCGTQTSSWVGPVSFTTACSGILQAPFSTDFESSNWIPSTSIVQPGTLAQCWDVSPQGTLFSWSVGPPFINQAQTGPDGDHTTGLGNYLHVGSYGLSNDLSTQLTLPKVDLSGNMDPVLEFWYHMYGGGIGDFMVLIREINTTNWDTLQVLSGQQQLAKSSPWIKSIFNLSNHINDTVEIQFVGTRPMYNPFIEMSIDDIYIGDKPSCVPSSGFYVKSNNDTSALLEWLSDSTYYWQVQYGPEGFLLGNGNTISTSSHPLRISGLQPNMIYEFYLRDSCTVTSFSQWQGPIKIRTNCGPILAPFAEDFEDTNWVNPLAYLNKGKVDTCWVREHLSLYYWETGPPFYTTIFTGPSGDHTTGTGQYLYTDRTANWAPTKTSISTPLLNLDSLVEPELTFWYHLHGSNIGGLDVEIDSGSGFESIFSLVGEQQKTDTAPWKEVVVNLADYSQKTVKLRFVGKSIYTFTNIAQAAIDDFSIHEAPPCPKPINLIADNIQINSAKVSWTSGGAIHWMMRIKPKGSTFSISGQFTNPTSLLNLQSDTEYEVWIRDSCGINDVSVWSGPLLFRTLCDPKPTPYYENFDGPGFISPAGFFQSGKLNSCWRRDYDDGFYWEAGPPHFITVNTGPIGDHTTGGGKYLVSDLRNFTTRDTAYVYSPQIDLTNLATPEMAFWYHMFGSGIYALRVEVDSGAGWNLIDTIYGQQQISKYDAWKERIVDLSVFTDDTIQLRFVSLRYTFSTNAEISIDDLHIYEAPNCGKPTNFNLTNVRSTEASFNWVGGGATNSTIRYKPSGGNYQYVGVSSASSFTLTNLQPDTQYEAWVRDSCSNGNQSLWVGPLVFRTECLPSYAPYLEDFDGSSWVPSTPGNLGQISTCWRRSDTTYISWLPFSGNAFSTLHGPAGPRSGVGNFVSFANIVYTIPKVESELFSPYVILSNLVSPELIFWYHMYGFHTDKVEVYVQYKDDTRTLLSTISGQQHASKLAPWTQKSISLANTSNDTVRIVFKGFKTAGFSGTFNVSIDDFEIVDAFCSPPTNLSASNPTRSAIDLSWQSNTVRSNIEYGPSGFPPGQGTTIYNVSSVYHLTGLQPYTSYDYYVQDSCRVNNSTWTGPYTFATFCDTLSPQFIFSSQGLNATFDASASHGNFLSYSWDFGDGTSGSGVNPTHTYTGANTYAVKLFVTDTCGQVDTVIQDVRVCNPATAVINYSVNGLIVSFDGSSSTSAVTYRWQFASVGTYINSNPIVAFPSKAVYNIYLVVADSCGGTDTAFLALNLCDKPLADFSYSVINSGGSGMTVAFDGTTSIGAQKFIWDFGDGNTDTSSATPTHTYVVPGLHYVVSLIVEGDCGRTDTLSYKLQDVVGISEDQSEGITVYPNPASDRLEVVLPDQFKNPEFVWYDQSGKRFNFEKQQKGHSFLFNVNEAASGAYILVIKEGNRTVSKTVVIQ